MSSKFDRKKEEEWGERHKLPILKMKDRISLQTLQTLQPQQLYTFTFDKINKMDQFFENHKLLKFILIEITNLNSLVTSTEIEFIVKHLK